MTFSVKAEKGLTAAYPMSVSTTYGSSFVKHSSGAASLLSHRVRDWDPAGAALKDRNHLYLSPEEPPL